MHQVRKNPQRELVEILQRFVVLLDMLEVEVRTTTRLLSHDSVQEQPERTVEMLHRWLFKSSQPVVECTELRRVLFSEPGLIAESV